MTRTAVAIAMALVVAGLGVGFAPAPGAATSSYDCDEEDPFTISSSKGLLPRSLDAGEVEIGEMVVSANDDVELVVELDDAGDNGELNFTVFEVDQANDVCDPVATDDCEQRIQKKDAEKQRRCDLPVESSDVTYHVEFEAGQQNGIDYFEWED